MSSIFPPFRRRRATEPGEETPRTGAEASGIGGETPTLPPPAVSVAAADPAPTVLTASLSPPTGEALEAMLTELSKYLPQTPATPLLPPNILLISLRERTAGLGHFRGHDVRGSFTVGALKAVRLEALVRFQLWAADLFQAETAVTDLKTRLMAYRDRPWPHGLLLRLALEASPPIEQVPDVSGWRGFADYRVLYEHHYRDSDGAESLIARIPIHSDPEELNSPDRETITVANETVRWDDNMAPALVLRGRLSIGRLSSLAFIPGSTPSGAVTLTRTFEGAAGSPTTFTTLANFLTAVAGPNPLERHARVSFASLSDFLAAFAAIGEPVTLGDWNTDDVPDSYEARILDFEPAIRLPGVLDLFEITYDGAAFDQVAVVYLRVTPR